MSKPLPSGKIFDLKEDPPELSKIIYIINLLGILFLEVMLLPIHTEIIKKKKHITEQIPDEVSDLFNQGANIASYIIFPKNRINNGQTINMARGVNSRLMIGLI